MRILQVISHYVPALTFGGPMHVAHGLSTALVASGHDVTVCCTNLKNPNETLNVPTDEPVFVDGVRVFYESVSFLRYYGYSTGMSARVRREASRADVIFTHFHFQYASLIGGLIARELNKPLVVFSHGSLNRHGLRAKNLAAKGLYLLACEERNFASSLFVAYHSYEERSQSLIFGQTTLVRIGVEIPLLAGAPKSGDPIPESRSPFTFAYLGRLAPGKGINIMIEAMAEVCRWSDAHLVLIGGDERGYEYELRARIAELKIEPRVTFVGLLAGHEKLATLQRADAFLLPSRSEGLSVATLEAMSVGLPVIVSNRVGLWREIRDHRCGYVVNYGVPDLTSAMKRMIADPERFEMGQRGRELVRTRYSWPDIVRNLISTLESGMLKTRRIIL